MVFQKMASCRTKKLVGIAKPEVDGHCTRHSGDANFYGINWRFQLAEWHACIGSGDCHRWRIIAIGNPEKGIENTMNANNYERSSDGTGRTFVMALAIFAMLCGGILLFVGHKGTEINGKGVQNNTDSILHDLNDATNALEDKNYGRAKYYLRAARKRINYLNE
jgi:hypothetical protein